MKKISFLIKLSLFLSMFFLVIGCSKESTPNDCKTCKAYGNGGSVTEREVCNEMEESNFRNENAGAEITCN